MKLIGYNNDIRNFVSSITPLLHTLLKDECMCLQKSENCKSLVL